jgi:hypothetical protein
MVRKHDPRNWKEKWKMTEEMDVERSFSLAEGEAFEAGSLTRMEMEGDYTKLDLGELADQYKLSDAYKNVRNLEYRSDTEIEVQTFADYRMVRAPAVRAPFEVERKPRPRYPRDEAYRNRRLRHLYPRGEMLVMVDKAVYNSVAGSINRYVRDVGRDGYWATIHVVQGGGPADIRGYITKRRPVGVLLVGAIAAPWFEMDDDFHGHSEFPCDLYYMDTNGTWTDPDGDGKFSGHGGNLDPEIWVGRLYTPTEGGNDAALINDYFARNRMYRRGKLGHARSGLAFVDDDWQGFGDCALDLQFPASALTVYTAPNVTDADLYKAEVNSLRSWVQLCAHSWPQGHALRVSGADEHIPYTYFKDTNPPNAHFYNLFCCGPGKYTTTDYLAGWYIFDKSGGGKNMGLAAIASAKSGSMLAFEDFYRPLGQGKCIGDAFVDWWRARGPNHDVGVRAWHYGLVLLGDPTLTWWKGAVPVPEQPQQGDVFDHWPREMQFRWDPVNIPGAKYTVELDAIGAISAGKWAEEINQTFGIYHNISGQTHDHSFVGAQRGRWRVRAQIGGQDCSWSQWSYFEFTR